MVESDMIEVKLRACMKNVQESKNKLDVGGKSRRGPKNR